MSLNTDLPPTIRISHVGRVHTFSASRPFTDRPWVLEPSTGRTYQFPPRDNSLVANLIQHLQYHRSGGKALDPRYGKVWVWPHRISLRPYPRTIKTAVDAGIFEYLADHYFGWRGSFSIVEDSRPILPYRATVVIEHLPNPWARVYHPSELPSTEIYESLAGHAVGVPFRLRPRLEETGRLIRSLHTPPPKLTVEPDSLGFDFTNAATRSQLSPAFWQRAEPLILRIIGTALGWTATTQPTLHHWSPQHR